MKFKPLHDRILVERIEKEEKTAGGIIIPDSAQEKPAEGKVIAVGDGAIMDNGSVRPMSLKSGDKVLFTKWAGNEIKLDGKDYLIVKENEILGIVS